MFCKVDQLYEEIHQSRIDRKVEEVQKYLRCALKNEEITRRAKEYGKIIKNGHKI